MTIDKLNWEFSDATQASIMIEFRLPALLASQFQSINDGPDDSDDIPAGLPELEALIDAWVQSIAGAISKAPA